ncbi:hypothetical protein FVEN_g6722 [Fusarium venenatum]|nr:hypothetical protein FVEN_g6722 [Fusarium venenatum]
MCIALLEISSPTTPNSSLVHIHGAGELIRLSSPEVFSTGIHHKLFIGIRPLLVIQALMLRKATFLADEDWIKAPFQLYEQSQLQNLLNLAAALPGILERIDALRDESAQTASKEAKGIITQLVKMKMKFELWAKSFEAESPMAHYWNQTNNNGLEDQNDTLCFSSLSTANALTCLWSVQIICMSHIQDLLARFPELAAFAIIVPITALRETCIELSARILRSMGFVMQDSFLLYGQFSATFPLHTAYHALSRDSKGRAVFDKLRKSLMPRISFEIGSFGKRIPTNGKRNV